LRKIFSVHQKFFTFPITNMWQVYTRPTSASDFFSRVFVCDLTFNNKSFSHWTKF
jgi:hypothetical protein